MSRWNTGRRLVSPASRIDLLAALFLTVLLCSATASARTLRVGVAGPKPWVVDTPGQNMADGFSIRLWQAVAGKLALPFRLVRMKSVEDQLQGVISGRIDIAVGPISITADRARKISFSQPYFSASLAILTVGEPPNLWERIRPFLSYAFAAVVAGLLLVIFVVGNVVWMLERRHNPGIPEEWASGVANAMWLTLVTMTTVGYGDRVPRTSFGRIVIGIWMLFATVMVSALTASITTALTLSNLDTTNIRSAEALSGKRVAVVSNTVGENFAHAFRAVVLRAPTLHEAIHLLITRRADAVVFDEPSLRFYMLRHTDLNLALLVASFDVQTFGYALPAQNKLLREVNIALLNLQESGDIRSLRDLWFSSIETRMHTGELQPAPTSNVLPPVPTFTGVPQPVTAPLASPSASPDEIKIPAR